MCLNIITPKTETVTNTDTNSRTNAAASAKITWASARRPPGSGPRCIRARFMSVVISISSSTTIIVSLSLSLSAYAARYARPRVAPAAGRLRPRGEVFGPNGLSMMLFTLYSLPLPLLFLSSSLLFSSLLLSCVLVLVLVLCCIVLYCITSCRVVSYCCFS